MPAQLSSSVPRRPLRVLLWSVQGGGRQYGGAGKAAYRTIGHFDPAEIAVDIAHGSDAQASHDTFRRQIYISRLLPFSEYKYLQLTFLLRARAWLLANAHEYDVFHGLLGYAFTTFPAYWAQQAGLPVAIKIANHERDLGGKGDLVPTTPRSREKQKRILHRADAMIAISRDIEREAAEYGIRPERIFFIPNGVDTEHFRPATPEERARSRAAAGLAENDAVIVFIGKVGNRKRPRFLIDAVAELHRRGVRAHLLLVGPEVRPGFAATLLEHARARGLASWVRWEGFREDTRPYLWMADCFCLPSENEGLSNAFLEALSSGTPVAVTAISGSRDVITPGVNGSLLGLDEPAEAWATELAHLLSSPDLRQRYAAAARETILKGYSIRKTAEQYESLYRQLAQARRPAAAATPLRLGCATLAGAIAE